MKIIKNNEPSKAINDQDRNKSNVKRMRKAFGRGVKKLVRAAKYLMKKNNSDNRNKNWKKSAPPKSRKVTTSTIENKIIKTNDMGGQKLKTTAFDNQSIHALTSQKNQPYNLNRVDNKPLLNINDLSVNEKQHFKQAIRESGINEELPIHSIKHMDGVIAQQGKNKLFLVNIDETSKDGLSNTGNLCTKNKGGLTSVYQVISSTADKALICVSELNDMLDGLVDVPLPCNHDINVSNLNFVGKGKESTVYSLNNEKVVAEVFDQKMIEDTDYRERLKSILSLIQFDHYVKCDSFSVSTNGKKAYITMEKLEKLDLNTFETSEIRSLLKKFFKGLKEMREKKVCHGDPSLENIMVRNNDGHKELALIDSGINTSNGISFKEGNNGMGDIMEAAELLRHGLDGKNYTKEFVKSITSLRETFYNQLRKNGVDINNLEPELFKNIGHFLGTYIDGIANYKIRNNLIKEFTKFFSNEKEVFNENVISNYHQVRHTSNNAAFINYVNENMKNYSDMEVNEFLDKNQGSVGEEYYDGSLGSWSEKAKDSAQYLVGLKLLTTVLKKADFNLMKTLPDFKDENMGVSEVGLILKKISEKKDCDAEFDSLVDSL